MEGKSHKVSQCVQVAVAQTAELSHRIEQTLLNAAQTARTRLPPAGILRSFLSTEVELVRCDHISATVTHLQPSGMVLQDFSGPSQVKLDMRRGCDLRGNNLQPAKFASSRATRDKVRSLACQHTCY